MAELQKLVSMKLDEAPIPASVSQKKIKFYNLDKNTAQFQFEVTNRDKPLLISDKNIKGYAFCVSENGSTSGVVDLDFIEPLKGIVGFTVPNTFLASATNTTATGEIYLSLNDVNNEGLDDTVVLGQFTFDVGDALINKVESDIKVDYIRMFDDLRATIENKIAQLESDVADINNIVSEVEQTGTNAITKIAKAQNDATTAITIAQETGVNSIDTERDNATRAIGALGESVANQLSQAKTEFDTNATNKTTEYNDNSIKILADLDAKKKKFDDDLAANNFLTPETFNEKTTALMWQKYSLTNNDGTTKQVTLESDLVKLRQLSPGFYYATYTPNTTNFTLPNRNCFITVIERSDKAVKKIFANPYNSNRVFAMYYFNGNSPEWSEWSEVGVSKPEDTGWVPFQLINGANSNTAYSGDKNGFVCAYRVIKRDNETNVKIRLNGSNISKGQTIAQLPSGLINYTQTGYLRVPTDKGVGVITIYTDGTIKFFPERDKEEIWTVDDVSYIYGQIEFTL